MGAAAQKAGEKFIHYGNFSILAELQIVFQHTGEHGVVALAVGHMVFSTQRIAHCVYRRAAGGAEGNAGEVGCHQEIIQQDMQGLTALGHEALVAMENHFDGFVSEQLGVGGSPGGQGGFHRMHQGINGAGGKHAEGQPLQQLGNEHRVVGIHGRAHQTQLGAQTGAGDDGEVGHLAARAAGGGDEHQLPPLIQGGGPVKQGVYPLAAGDCQDLGDVEHCAAANGNDTGTAHSGRVGQNGVYHHIGGFSGAVFLLIDGVNRKSHLAEVGLVDVFISQNQIPFSRMKFLYKVQTGLKAVKRGAD